jgi:hypothetical protein
MMCDLDPTKLRTTGVVAEALLRHALALDPESASMGATHAEIAMLAAFVLSHVECAPCPRCGAEPFVNIDCDVCLICAKLLSGELP